MFLRRMEMQGSALVVTLLNNDRISFDSFDISVF